MLSQPNMFLSVAVFVPDVVKVWLFHTKGTCEAQMTESLSELAASTVKFNVATLSHPNTLLSVTVVVPEADNI